VARAGAFRNTCTTSQVTRSRPCSTRETSCSGPAFGPALLAVQRSGWEEVERSYREALSHQRGGPAENDDAITAAAAALEATLKAVGLAGNTLGALATAFGKSDLATPELAQVPDLLRNLVQRVASVRNVHGDAHGKDAGAAPVPQSLVNLAIHMVGAFIVYLDERAP
jgi:hypothetical protein